jgi:ATP-dependent protease ClpP protease subunit
MLKILIVLVGLLGTTLSSAKETFIRGIITERTAVQVTSYIDFYPNPVIIINSPGGLVEEGMLIISKIREVQMRGKSVSCIVAGEAASMAFYIWSVCDQRFAVSGSMLMFHAAYAIFPDSKQSLEELEEVVAKLKKSWYTLDVPTLTTLQVEEKDYREMRKIEKQWSPEALKAWAPKFIFTILGDK